MIRFAMEIFIHSHYKTHEPIELEVYEFTGERIPVDLIDYILNEGKVNELEAFDCLEADVSYMVIVIASFDELWSLECKSFVRLPIPEEAMFGGRKEASGNCNQWIPYVRKRR